MSERLIIVGASVRSVAFSARRAGFSPLAADLFADVDLQRCCQTVRVESYPNGLLVALQQADPSWQLGSVPWMYTGAFENHPVVVERLAAARPLYGNCADVLRKVRDPATLAEALAVAGFLFPETITHAGKTGVTWRSAEATLSGAWLSKPTHGSGGGGIMVYDSGMEWPRSSHYLQRRVEGTPVSAVYVAAGGDCRLLGVTRQLIGSAWAGADGFCYAGSVGPLALEEKLWRTFHDLGRHLSERFGLVGLLGVDAVICGDQVVVIEVNPRYTASVEILERALDLSSVAYHVAACRDDRLPCGAERASAVCHGKVILYAERETVVPEAFSRYAEECNAAAGDAELSWPSVADIPAAGSRIAKGWPITTLFASGANVSEAIAALRDRAEETRGRFFA